MAKQVNLYRLSDSVNPNKVYIEAQTPQGAKAFEVPNVQALQQLGLDVGRVEERANQPQPINFEGMLTSPQQILKYYAGEKLLAPDRQAYQIGAGGVATKIAGEGYEHAGDIFGKLFTAGSFQQGAGDFALPAPSQPTAYEQYIKGGGTAGQYAQQQQQQFPEKYPVAPPVTPAAPLASLTAPSGTTPITIGDILYPSQDHYNKNVTAKGLKAVGGREVPITPTPTASLPTAPSPEVPESLMKVWESIQTQVGGLAERIKTEGVTGAEGQVLVPPSAGVPGVPSPVDEEIGELPPTGDTGIAYDDLPDDVKSLVDQAKGTAVGEGDETTTPIDVTGTTVKLQDTDIETILGDVSSGALDTPELKLSEEAKNLAEAGETRRVGQVMNQVQKQLARSGMAFSGIRTKAEQDVIAESLSRKAGISLNFANTLLTAARAEQNRRIAASQEAQKAEIAMYKDMGYVKIGDQLYPTMAREKWEEQERDEAQATALSTLASMGYTLVGDTVYPTLAREKFEEPEAEPTSPASVREYEYAVEQGYTGTFEQWKNQEATVGFSQWAAALGIVGMNIGDATVITQQAAADEAKSEKERQQASLRTNIYEWIDSGKSMPRQQFINDLIANHNLLNRKLIEATIDLEIQKTDAPLNPERELTFPERAKGIAESVTDFLKSL